MEPEERQMTSDLQIRVDRIQAIIPVGLQAVGEAQRHYTRGVAGMQLWGGGRRYRGLR